MSGCPYRYLFGVPGTGAHSYRIFGLAAVDIFLTILLAATTAKYTNSSFLVHLIFWLIVGEVLHYLFGTQTAFLTWMGIDAESKCSNFFNTNV